VRSIEFYRLLAGFAIVSDAERVAEWRWAMLRSGNVELMLSESHGPHEALRAARVEDEDSGWGVIHYFYPEDVVAAHARCLAQGIAASPLRVTYYGMKEFEVRDPDGHILWFGQQTREQPPAGCDVDAHR
jgi:uncharacterized glyoxalase superfamily protein PhnB